MVDISNNNNSQKDIIDNLLIKEEAGNMHYFQDKSSAKPNQPLASISSNVTTNSNSSDVDVDTQEIVNQQLNQITTAPQDDSFSHTLPSQAKAEEKSELVFHPDDKEQTDRLAESVPVDDSKKYSIEKIIEKLLSKQNLKLDSNNEVLFTNLILDFFRNRRSVIASRELIATKITFKEKTLDGAVVDNILSVIKSLKNKIDSEGGLVVDAESMKKEELAKVISTPIVEEKKQTEPILEAATDIGKPEANIFAEDVQENKQEDNDVEDSNKGLHINDSGIVEQLNKIAKDELSTEDMTKSKASSIEAKEGPGSEGVSTTVKFGIQPKGVNEDEPLGNPEMGKETKAELDESLADLKSIIPNIVTDDSEVKEEDKLLKELSLDNVVDADKSEQASKVAREDLHDIGQLMTGDDKEEESESEEFVIKKIKPADVLTVASEVEKEEPADKTDNKEVQDIDNVNKSEEKSVDADKLNEDQESKSEVSPLPRVIRPEQTFSIKPKISDIQQVATSEGNVKHVLTGPVDELRGMTLKNFRFLGTNVDDRKNKILEKISILEQDSYTKKAAGIKAWRESPVNQLYLNLGAESMTTAKDMTVLIDEKKAAGEETLEMEEFSSISDLNKNLRF